MLVAAAVVPCVLTLPCCPAVGRSFEELDPAARRYVGSVGKIKQVLHLCAVWLLAVRHCLPIRQYQQYAGSFLH